jgi:hypothetical protein
MMIDKERLTVMVPGDCCGIRGSTLRKGAIENKPFKSLESVEAKTTAV